MVACSRWWEGGKCLNYLEEFCVVCLEACKVIGEILVGNDIFKNYIIPLDGGTGEIVEGSDHLLPHFHLCDIFLQLTFMPPVSFGVS